MKQSVAFLVITLWISCITTIAQESTGTIRGTVSDIAGARVAGVRVTVRNEATGVEHRVASTDAGVFAAPMLPPADYLITVQMNGMAAQTRSVHLDVAGEIELEFVLKVARAQETVNVSEDVPIVETQISTGANVIEQKDIEDLPLNGRRFSDLALLAPGVTQDPRSLTSASNGDLAFGGIRGYQASFLVDGSDNNNGFFAQARGRYRAPYQFSNEVIQEFRVSSNSYGVEIGRTGGGVINVVTKSGSNRTHGSAFYYLRDKAFNAQQPYTDVKPADRQQQFGFTVGGPIRRNRAFYYAGFDQHLFHVPTLVRFLDGSTTVTPTTGDYEPRDEALVRATAQQLSGEAGNYRSALLGNAAYLKLDWTISPRHYLMTRINVSRYYGSNNVFFDPASPITTYAISENGEEDVATETISSQLTSGLSDRATSQLRVQWSRDLQESFSNSEDIRTRVADIIDAFGRSAILPRQTRERRLHVADTISVEGNRHSWKLGADVQLTWIRNYFPMLFGGQYIFDNVRVNQWTFEPQTYGLKLSPLRAYAHQVPRYYTQNFGSAVSNPDTHEYAFFAQDTIRATNHLGLTLGLRYDLQTFRSEGLASNPLWPDSGRVPKDRNNVAPRVGFAYSRGKRPVVFRGGYGIFYTRIPQIYNSAVETENGLNRMHLFLDNWEYWDRQLFPRYPNPAANCPSGVTVCAPPESLSGRLTSEISAFARDFQTPFVQQSSLSVEREVARRLAVAATYQYVHGEHLIRGRDVNLPEPEIVSYPVFDESGETFTGDYYSVPSFSEWEMNRTLTCPYPPCLEGPNRPIPQLGAVNVFESAASSVYHGLTLSIRRRMTRGVYFRGAYTWARAIDDGQDALVVGRPATVQNSYNPSAERSSSSIDQRHRFVFSWITEPRPFHRDHPILKKAFNDWKFSGVITIGSGRPVNARVIGDGNGDGNSENDRLPGASRNSYVGPDYATTNIRLSRRLHLSRRVRTELMLECFNLLNRTNQRVTTTDDGWQNTAAQFEYGEHVISGSHYPARYRLSGRFLEPKDSYAPRQVQFALRVAF